MIDERNQDDVPAPEQSFIPTWISDDKARQEVTNWGNDALLQGQLQRNQIVHLKIYGFVVASAMVFFSMLYIASLGIWAFHYLAPDRWGFLTEHQLSKIQSILFSGSVGAVVSSVMSKHMSK